MGIIDEVCIYNRALNPVEIKVNMNSEGFAVNPDEEIALTWGEVKASKY